MSVVERGQYLRVRTFLLFVYIMDVELLTRRAHALLGFQISLHISLFFVSITAINVGNVCFK